MNLMALEAATAGNAFTELLGGIAPEGTPTWALRALRDLQTAIENRCDTLKTYVINIIFIYFKYNFYINIYICLI